MERMTPEEWVAMFFLWVFGTIAGLVITGFLADRLVIRKVIQNEDVQELITLFREGKDYLKKLLENQKRDEKE